MDINSRKLEAVGWVIAAGFVAAAGFVSGKPIYFYLAALNLVVAVVRLRPQRNKSTITNGE